MKIKIEPQTINVNIKAERVYPELENLEVEATTKEQKFKSEKYGYNEVTVLPKTVKLQEKTINSNGEYVADDGFDGLGKVKVETNGVDISDYYITDTTGVTYTPGNIKNFIKKVPSIDTKNLKNMQQFFYEMYNLEEIEEIDTSNVTNMNSMFGSCYSLKSIPKLNTQNVIDVGNMFYQCHNLRTIPELDFGSVIFLNNATFNYCGVRNLGGFKDLGKAYEVSSAENTGAYVLNLSYNVNLTHESLMNVINDLYDIKTKGCKNQRLNLGAKNLAKLTAEEIKIATDKGWNVT